jgi:hypothetical protein
MKMTIRLTGTSPLVLHNNILADPLHEAKRAMDKLTSKRKKTDADHEEIRRLEFIASLYMDHRGPIMPMANCRKMLIEGGKKDRNGKQFESGLLMVADAFIEHDGPQRKPDATDDEHELYMSRLYGKFGWSTIVGNQKNKIVRTRPKFDEWAFEFQIELIEDLLDEPTVRMALQKAERGVGIGDGRSIGFGRFKAKVVSVE